MTHITSTVYLRLQLASALSGSPFNEKTRSTTRLPVGIDFHLSSRAANDLYVDLRVDFSCLTSASVSAWTFNVKKRPRCFESRGVNNPPINIWLFEVSTTHILVWCSFCMIFAEPRKDGLKESWVPKFQWCYSFWALDLSAFSFVQNVAVGSPSLSRMALSLGNRLPSLQQLPGNRFECLEVKRGGFTYVQEGNWWKLCSVSQAWRWNSFTSEGFLGALSYTNTNLLVVICGWLDVWLCCMR